MSDHLLAELGFPAFHDVVGQASVARLYAAGQRCGIYVLGFADGERYVGQALDVTKRYLNHRKTYADLIQLSFKRVSAEALDAEEQRCIHTLEAGGMLLRNFTHMSVVRGSRAFDEVVTPEEQAAWLRSDPDFQDDEAHVHDESLRRRQRHKFEQFMTLPHAQEALTLLGLYLMSTLPFPRRTEQDFWIVSCLPGGVGKEYSLYCRVTVNMQENFSMYGNENGLESSFHMAISPLKELLGEDWQRQLEENEYEVSGHRYKSGGHDQTQVSAFEYDHARVLLTSRETLQAMAILNSRLMRRGGTHQPGSHCPQLVDAAIAAARQALEMEMNQGE
ncbi:GIY-YIG nuclease family protein [Deinococcus psychrotolerans]|uniref:GIY-YIG nuclease family protein n=1 Tax=Deinococcus psychrotolerans TaxID=2489213 RepID=A0A3G8YRF2_9DEIO|nr:GIY-YIG nuclease family protein [Deinococcus psychrotolerans]AZI44331.1 GIY-YIG nuclease family protein [Deinococcus psychrotolerans]